MSGAALDLAGLSVSLAERAVVRDVSLGWPVGTLAAIVGPNGAGKTSLLRALVGLLPFTGAARFRGRDLGAIPPRERARILAYLPQGHAAHWPLPARDIVALGRLPHGARDPDRLGPEDRRAVAEAMRLTEIDGLADRPVTELSGGERARVALARVFAVEAPVILADEPNAALDPQHQLTVMAALAARAKAGALVIVITHDLGLAARFAGRVAVMAEGRLAAEGPPAEALAPAILGRVFGIEAYAAAHEGEPVLVPWRSRT